MAAPQPRALTIHHLGRHLVLIVFTVAAAATARAAASSSTHTTSAPVPRAAAESPSPAAALSFLRARCDTTLYPALCYDSLLPCASEVQENQSRLARVAADVAAARLRALSARVKGILRHAGPDPEPAEGGGGGRPSETAALRDCASTISAAANLARQSSAELTKLLEPDAAGTTSSSSSSAAGGGTSSRQARWEVSNAKTWLSAAMTNEGTCADGLVEAAGAAAAASPAGKEVTARVATVKQYTSNALALVNGIPL